MGYVSEKFTPGFRLTDGNQLNKLVQEINSGPGSGPTYYVNATKGSDNLNNTGVNPYAPLATLDRALAIESAALDSLGLSSVGRNAIIASAIFLLPVPVIPVVGCKPSDVSAAAIHGVV